MTPAKSQAQFRKMFILYKQGKITKKQLDEFTKGVRYSKLPVKKARKASRKGRGK